MKKQKATWKCNDCINHRYECLICHKMGYDANYYEQMIEQGLIEEKEGDETLKKSRDACELSERQVRTPHQQAVLPV